MNQTQTPTEPSINGSAKAPLPVTIIALIAIFFTLYFARTFFVPVVIALFIALTLGPVVQALRYFRIPGALSAALLIALSGLGIFAGVLTLAAPFADLVDDAPQIAAQLQDRLQTLRDPVESINEVGEQVEKIAESQDDSGASEVVVKQPGLITRAADDLIAAFATFVLVLVLSFFLLVSRDLFFGKAVRIFPRLSDKKKVLSLIKEIETDVSRYLLTVAIINVCLGLIIGLGFLLLDMPTPHLWIVLAALLNFLPYVGAMIGILMSFGVAAITFDTLSLALLPAGFYLLLTVIEGQFVTPMILGRRFSMNTVVILLSIAFWGFLWGPIGVLVAVPLLIVFKVLCERVDGLTHFGAFLSGERPADEQEEDRDSRVKVASGR